MKKIITILILIFMLLLMSVYLYSTYNVENVKENNIINEEYDFRIYNIENTENNIKKLLKEINNNFDINDYEISVQKLQDDDRKEIISYGFKIGDFKTDFGYVIYVEDGKITSIHENNLNSKEMKKLLDNKNNFFVSKEKIEVYMSKAKKGQSNIRKEEYELYYDFEIQEKVLHIILHFEGELAYFKDFYYKL